MPAGRDFAGQRPTAPDTAPVPPAERAAAPPVTGTDRRVALYPLPRGGGARTRGPGRATALPVGVPAAPAFPSPLELQRALRPLQGYRTAAPPLRTTLDETATAELSARAGAWCCPSSAG